MSCASTSRCGHTQILSFCIKTYPAGQDAAFLMLALQYNLLNS